MRETRIGITEEREGYFVLELARQHKEDELDLEGNANCLLVHEVVRWHDELGLELARQHKELELEGNTNWGETRKKVRIRGRREFFSPAGGSKKEV